MLGQCNLVNLSFILEVFWEYDLVNCRSIIGLLLQTLFDYHIKVLGDPLWNRLVLLFLDFLLKLLNVLSVVRVLVRTHLVEHNTQSPNIRRLWLLLVLPKFRRQIVRCANPLNLFLLLALTRFCISCLNLDFFADSLETVVGLIRVRQILIFNSLDVAKVS